MSSSNFSLPTAPVQTSRTNITAPLSVLAPAPAFSQPLPPSPSSSYGAKAGNKNQRPEFDPTRLRILSHGTHINALETGLIGRPTSSTLVGSPLQMTPLFEVAVNQDVGFFMDWGAGLGVSDGKGEKEGSFFFEGG